jgi:hypothetical protein
VSNEVLVFIIGYRMGVSTYGGFEPVRTTWSKAEAIEWVSKPTEEEHAMRVFSECRLDVGEP